MRCLCVFVIVWCLGLFWRVTGFALCFCGFGGCFGLRGLLMVFGGAVAAVAPGGFVFYIYCLRLLRFGVGGWVVCAACSFAM